MADREGQLSHADASGKARMLSESGKAAADLARLFRRNGYVRAPNLKRREKEKTRYKKGWEVRLILKSRNELRDARRLLQQAGLRAGRPFRKVKQWALPVYGKPAVDLFRSWAKGDD